MGGSSDQSISNGLKAVVAVFGIFVVGLIAAIGFAPPSILGSGTVIAAAVALVGGLVTTAITAVGLILKQSVDLRTIALAEEVEARKAALDREESVRQREAEVRLALETGLKAVQLFATSTGQAAPPIQRVAALFTLVSLRQFDLTVSLVLGLLDTDDIRPDDAASILDRVFLAKGNGADQARSLALDGLQYRAAKLVTDRTVALPDALIYGLTSIESSDVRHAMTLFYARMLLARPLDQWRSDRPSPASLLGAILAAWVEESQADNKRDLGLLLSHALPLYPAGYSGVFRDRTFSFDEVTKAVAGSQPATLDMERLSASLQEWSQGLPSTVIQPQALSVPSTPALPPLTVV